MTANSSYLNDSKKKVHPDSYSDKSHIGKCILCSISLNDFLNSNLVVLRGESPIQWEFTLIISRIFPCATQTCKCQYNMGNENFKVYDSWNSLIVDSVYIKF